MRTAQQPRAHRRQTRGPHVTPLPAAQRWPGAAPPTGSSPGVAAYLRSSGKPSPVRLQFSLGCAQGYQAAIAAARTALRRLVDTRLLDLRPVQQPGEADQGDNRDDGVEETGAHLSPLAGPAQGHFVSRPRRAPSGQTSRAEVGRASTRPESMAATGLEVLLVLVRNRPAGSRRIGRLHMANASVAADLITGQAAFSDRVYEPDDSAARRSNCSRSAGRKVDRGVIDSISSTDSL
jgi:hypothetical protein